MKKHKISKTAFLNREKRSKSICPDCGAALKASEVIYGCFECAKKLSKT